ncbi:hypothetical protein FRC17_000481 [Serendipita sp. 399]|nr:hypothetical protein FRC17_000481 [Serendipita sp. 399]
MSDQKVPSVAFLGPLGTFSHQVFSTISTPDVRPKIDATLQVTHQYFGDSVSYQPQSSIANVHHALSPEIQYACIPLANSTHGSVIETFDLLRDSRWPTEISICGETVLKVEHCLVVRTAPHTNINTDIENRDLMRSITAVLSHEQALGQCFNWLSTNLPNAKRIKTSSTSRAAQMISDGTLPEGTGDGLVAAICAEICLQSYPNLTILARNLQDRDDNQTRFIIARHNSAKNSSVILPTVNRFPSRVLIRIALENVPLHRLFELLTNTRLWSSTRLERMDKRPSLAGHGPLWSDVYFLEFSIGAHDAAFSLEKELEQLRKNLGLDGSAVTLLGSW